MILTLKNNIFVLATFFVMSFSAGFSQNRQSKPTGQSALEAFSKGNFESAFIQFNELSVNYPRDPLYKYYCGVSLVKLGKDPAKAVSLFKEAQQSSAAIRAVPANVTFYQGRAQQLSGNFAEAIKSYNLYTEQVGKKAAKETLTPQYIKQCIEKEGEIEKAKIADKDIIRKDSVPTVKKEKVLLAEKPDNHESDTTKKEDKSLQPDYEKLLNRALNYQFRADSLMKRAKMTADSYKIL